MANTVHGPFTPINVVNGSTPANATWGNAVQTQADVALNGFNPDLVSSAFVLSGLACVKDATNAKQLNVTAGAVYVTLSDGTRGKISCSSSTQTTSAVSSTYYLYLQPDGSWYWSTSNSPATNSLSIAQVTTDTGGNISGVTDKRVFQTQLYGGAKSGPAIATPLATLATQNAGLAASVVGGVTFGQTGSLPNSMSTAALFNGSTGYLTFPTTGLPTGNNPWSISARFKTSYAGGSQVILFAGAGAGMAKTAMWLYLDSAGHVIMDLYSSNITSASSGYNNGAWHGVIATWDGTNATLYVDGSQVATSATLGPDNISYSYGLIGVYWTGSAYSAFFNGTLHKVAVYGAALTSGNVTTLQNAATSLTSDGYDAAVLGLTPLRYYTLGDASGSSAVADTTSPTNMALVNVAGQVVAPLSSTGVNTMTSAAGVNDVLDVINGSDPTWQANIGISTTGLQIWDQKNGGLILSSATKNGITLNAPIKSLGGQATAGSFGAPVIVAQALDVHVTSTASQFILIYAPAVTGLYRVNMHIAKLNTTSNLITGQVNYVEPHANVQFAANFFASANGVNGYLTGISGGLSVPNSAIACAPLDIWAEASQNITVTYTDPSGTPNDYVTASIERLA